DGTGCAVGTSGGGGGNRLRGVLPGGEFSLVSPPLPYGDLDGDGTPDLLVFRRADSKLAPLQAVSGKTGVPIWTADELGPKEGSLFRWDDCFVQLHHLECCNLDGNGPAIIFIYSLNRDTQAYRAVLSGRDGKLKWKPVQLPWNDRRGILTNKLRFRLGYTDLNGDGVLDLLVWGKGPSGEVLSAFDGRKWEPVVGI